MIPNLRTLASGALASVALASLLSACGGAAPSADTSALSSALESSTAASGTLLCAPADLQVAACDGKAAGDACLLTSPSGVAVDGTCRATLDASVVACAPNPPAPPAELVQACAGKALADACQVTEPFGDTRSGTCVTARDGTTLVCGRDRSPPQAAVDACASLATGAACTMAGHGGMAPARGVCSLGPASTGPLACSMQWDLLPNGQAACAGIPAGAACTVGHRHAQVAGTCVVPTAGSAAVCVVPCADLGGRFACGPVGGMMGGGMGGHR